MIMLQNITIQKSDIQTLNDVQTVEEAAFGGPKEAELSLNLLNDESAQPAISLLAYSNNIPVGHILFTKATLQNSKSPLMYILAPLAVIPEFQNKGIGGLLIRKGLEILQEMKCELVFVLGHISYYPKHGFINNALKLGFSAPYPIPEEVKDAWMVQELNHGTLKRFNGKVLCAKAMDKLEYWRE